MINNYIKVFFVFILLSSNQIIAQQNEFWAKIDEAKVSKPLLQIDQNIKKYQTFQLKLDKFNRKLQSAPGEHTDIKSTNFIMQFPDENGRLISFQVKESPVMHPDLAKQFPENRSYKGVGVDDHSVKIRFSANELGLHAMIISKDRKVQYIDPISKDRSNYRVYARKDLNLKNSEFQCFTKNLKTPDKSKTSLKNANDKKLRTYRLALASTGEYSQFHIDEAGLNGGTDAQKKAIVLAAMTTAMTRVNAVYENDLAMTLQIVANNTDIIFLDAVTDPYTNDDGAAMLGENQTTCDNVIKPANYDIGHVFSTGGGGIATLKSACTASKARGVTGSSNPTGDFFYYDFVAHEMGHQFGANHTFNGDEGNCAGANRNDNTAYEPGSGSTLMAYAGLCAPQNVQSHSDLYFHAISIDEIWTNIISGTSTCGKTTNIINNSHVPIANAGVNFTIPKSTPYKLVGQGNDADGDPITFCWEQMDKEVNGVTVPPSEKSTAGALYRSVDPSVENIRYLPNLKTLISGSISSTWEVTPSVSREINFRLTVRDNNIQGGQSASSDMIVNVTDVAGPFKLTSQNETDLVWDKNSSQLITWDVAGTTGNGINTSKVNILLSTDGGKTYPTVLSANTPNDGTQNITVPNIAAPNCHVMVEAIGNIFLSVNGSSFSIGEFSTICNTFTSTDVPKNIPDDDLNGVISTITINDDKSIDDINVSVKLSHTYVSDLTLSLESPNGTTIALIANQCDGPNQDMDVVYDDEGDILNCESSAPVISGTIQPFDFLSDLNGETSSGVWRLKIADSFPVDTGILENWSLELCYSEPVLGIDDLSLKNFVVYPNPSQGSFKVSFIQEYETVEITLFDLLGRNIKKRSFKSFHPVFEEILNFSDVSGGIYLLRVKNGNQISTVKIRIE